jgi:microcystin-dependent protein
MIGMWEGNTAPEGWAICDGSSYTIGGQVITTPDLRNRFVRFANDNDRNISGGLMAIGLGTYTSTGGAHTHRPSSNNSRGGSTLSVKHHTAVGHFHSNTNNWRELIPEYYSLTFIMKLPE